MMNFYFEEFRKIRKNKKITAQNIADKLKLSRTTVSFWGTGKYKPSMTHIQALAEILDIPVNKISDLDEDYLKPTKDKENAKLQEKLKATMFELSEAIKYKNIFQHLDDYFYELKKPSTIKKYNFSCLHLFNIVDQNTDIVNMNFNSYFKDDDENFINLISLHRLAFSGKIISKNEIKLPFDKGFGRISIQPIYFDSQVDSILIHITDITVEKKFILKQQKLIKENELLKNAMNYIPYAIRIRKSEQDSPYFYMNKKNEEIFDCSCENFKNDPSYWLKKIHPDDRAKVLQVKKLYDSNYYCSENDSKTFEYRINKHNKIKWVHECFFKIFRQGEYLQGSIIQDITEQKSSKTYQTSIENILDLSDTGIWIGEIKNNELSLSYVNKAHYRRFGVSKRQRLNAPLYNSKIFEEDLSIILEKIKRSDEIVSSNKVDNISYEYRIHGKKIRWIKENRWSKKIDGIIHTGGSAIEVTEEKKLLESVNSTRSKMESLISGMECYYWSKNLNGEYETINEIGLEFFNLKLKDVLGKKDSELPWRESAKILLQHDDEVIRTGLPNTYDEVLKMDDGTNFTIKVSKVPLFDNQKKVIGTMGLSVDIRSFSKLSTILRKVEEN